MLLQLQYSMCTVDVSLPPFKLQPQLLNNCKFSVAPHSCSHSKLLNSVGHLIVVMFEYLQPVLLYKYNKLKVTAWPNSVKASVFYFMHQQHLHVIFLLILGRSLLCI